MAMHVVPKASPDTLPELATYEKASWGPMEASKWIWSDRREWLDVCPVLAKV